MVLDLEALDPVALLEVVLEEALAAVTAAVVGTADDPGGAQADVLAAAGRTVFRRAAADALIRCLYSRRSTIAILPCSMEAAGLQTTTTIRFRLRAVAAAVAAVAAGSPRRKSAARGVAEGFEEKSARFEPSPYCRPKSG